MCSVIQIENRTSGLMDDPGLMQLDCVSFFFAVYLFSVVVLFLYHPMMFCCRSSVFVAMSRCSLPWQRGNGYSCCRRETFNTGGRQLV